MTIKYLLDTNIISELGKKQPHINTLKFLEFHWKRVAIPTIVLHELFYGMEIIEEKNRQEQIRSFLADVVGLLPTIAYDEYAAKWHARERARLTKTGRTPPFVDGQIASIAAVHELILITNNTKDFIHFEGLKLASAESFHSL